jgi:N-acetylglucosamine kinase-like BadF-type ATPase
MGTKIGVDGGGTKTECILVDGSGTVVARQLAPGCNPNIVGRAEAARIVKDALAALLAAARLPPATAPSVTLLCMAGSRVFWSEFAASLEGRGRAVATDDSLPVLELATDGGPGLVLHAGTGSFVAARAGAGLEDVHYAGGLGFRFGDPGSGYDIGQRAISRALLEIEGWRAPSALGALLREVAGSASIDTILGYFYNDPAPNARIAAVAPAVLRLAAGGDPQARAVAVESASGLLELAVSVAATLFPGLPPSSLRAGLSGSILTQPVIAEALAARSPFTLRPVDAAPIEGVRRLLTRLAE